MVPWQIAAALVFVIIVDRVLWHFRSENCQERIDAAKREVRRDTMAMYRQTYVQAWNEGAWDRLQADKSAKEDKDRA